jgi:hypothetical protein
MPTILIHNQSGSSGRVYNIWSEQPSVNGGGVQATTPVIWYRSRPLPNNSQDVFKFSSDYYGFVGSSSSSSSELPNGDEIFLQGSEKVKPGSALDDGTRLLIDKNLNITQMEAVALKGNFEIFSKVEVLAANHNVVGLARLQDGESMPAPVAVVELKPGVGITFSPKQAVIIRATSWEQGTVQKPAGTYKEIRVDFAGAQTKAVVVEQSSGDFKVTYK